MPNGSYIDVDTKTIRNKKVVAGKGREREIDIEDILLSKYPDSVRGEWQKIKGIAEYTDEFGENCKIELHWYKNSDIIDYADIKLKPQSDGSWYIYES